MGVPLSLSVVEASRPTGLSDAADQLRATLADIDTIISGQRDALARLDEAWRGEAAGAAADQAMRDLARQQSIRGRLARLHSVLVTGGAQLSSIRSAVLSVVDPLRASGWQVHDDGSAIAPPHPEILHVLESGFTAVIQRLLELFGKTDTATAMAINVAMTEPERLPGVDAVSFGIGAGEVPLSPEAGSDEQRQNQIDAFRAATGHDPQTPNDWRTAAMLDESNYSDKNGDVESNVVVGRISPVAGQGSVQANLFIPGEEAWYPDPLGGISGHNLGDNRGFDPNAGPEASRVVLYVDYENGLAVARQNPSIDTRTGEIKVGTPRVNVSQNLNGSILLDYKAADPFSPGGEDLALSSPFNVNGQLAIKPTDYGPIAGGIVSSFPAIEMYHHGVEGTSEIAKIMPQNITQAGPLLGLPLSQNVGTPLMGEFPDTVLPPVPRVPDLDVGPVKDPPVRQIPEPFVIPYPSVELGPVDDNVRVPVGK